MRTAIAVLLALNTVGVFAAWQAPEAPPPAGAPPAEANSPAVTGGKTADVRPATGSPVDPKAYVIGPEDVLYVDVWREPANSGHFVVRPDGKISLPLIGEIQAAGLTPIQLGSSIAQGLQRILTHPEVTVGVERVNSKKYFIQGEINRPGSYPLTVPTSVLEALVQAGGFREFANTKKIIILRGSERLKFNYHEVTKGKHMEQNIRIEPGDQIIVQ
jgi:polysaccharide biosynthesis/export protein